MPNSTITVELLSKREKLYCDSRVWHIREKLYCDSRVWHIYTPLLIGFQTPVSEQTIHQFHKDGHYDPPLTKMFTTIGLGFNIGPFGIYFINLLFGNYSLADTISIVSELFYVYCRIYESNTQIVIMIENPQRQANEGTVEDRRTVYRTIKAFGVLDIIFGISLLACGVVSDYYSGETFGPPFYTGCFIAGTFVFVKGIFYISWAVNKTKTITGTESSCTQWTPCLCLSCMICFMGCIFGIIFVGMSGFFDTCGSKTWLRKKEACYNNEEKRYLAIATVALLLCCFLFIITTIGYMCSNKKFSAVAAVKRRHRNTVLPGRQMEIAMRNQMHMHQMAASQDQRFGGYQPASHPHGGVQVGAVGVGYHTDQNYPQGYSQLRATSTQAPNTGYAIGQSNPQGYSQYGTTTPQHQGRGPHSYSNSPPKSYPAYNPSTPTAHPPSYFLTPTAPPPSYDEIMKQ